MEKKKEIMKCCLEDRHNSFYGRTPGFVKKHGIDLIIKFLILLLNSFGKKSLVSKDMIFFLDEVKNGSMISNLRQTQKNAQKTEDTLLICLYKKDREGHVKAGRIQVVIWGLQLILACIVSFFQACFTPKSFEECIFEKLYDLILKYMARISLANHILMIMSDHHFYSTIFAMNNDKTSAVIQHGLILTKKFYLPVRAAYFCAWGNHSKELMEDNEKVIVTGTHKFDNCRNENALTEGGKDMLYCVSSLDNDLVKKRIEILNKIASEQGLRFSVKLHPGSMFDLAHWQNLFKDTEIVFYKEEKLPDLKFDFAISENSTVNVDFVVMGKPFILFDEDAGYFERYLDIIPNATDEAGIRECIQNRQSYHYDEIYSKILDEELNQGNCEIIRCVKEAIGVR